MPQNKPLIDVEDKTPDVRVTINFRPEEEKELKQYCVYADNSSLHHVVRAAVRRLCSQDKGFQEYKAKNPGTVPMQAAAPKPRQGRKNAAPNQETEQPKVA